MRAEALKILHAAHQGIVYSKKLARDLMYWPGINRRIEDVFSRCSTCQEFRTMRPKEPLLPTAIPTGPWEHIAEDLFECLGHKWLICVDYFSGYFEIERMDNGTNGSEVIRQTKIWFSVHGIPEKITSDNGPLGMVGNGKSLPRHMDLSIAQYLQHISKRMEWRKKQLE